MSARLRVKRVERVTRSLMVALVAGPLTLLVSGCYHYRVGSPNVSELSDPVSETKWSLLWGLLQEEASDTSCICKNNPLKEVTASSNLGYMLLGTLTVGLVVPLEVEYVCGKPPPGAPFPDPPRGCGDEAALVPPPDSEPDAEPSAQPNADPLTEPIDDPDGGSF